MKESKKLTRDDLKKMIMEEKEAMEKENKKFISLNELKQMIREEASKYFKSKKQSPETNPYRPNEKTPNHRMSGVNWNKVKKNSK